jgi:hypothetical protein
MSRIKEVEEVEEEEEEEEEKKYAITLKTYKQKTTPSQARSAFPSPTSTKYQPTSQPT